MAGAHPTDYARIAPPKSFIHAEWFSSAPSLARYLRYLAHNSSAYMEYFRWKENFGISTTSVPCRLCALAHEVLRPVEPGGPEPAGQLTRQHTIAQSDTQFVPSRRQFYTDVYSWWTCNAAIGKVCTTQNWTGPDPDFDRW